MPLRRPPGRVERILDAELLLLHLDLGRRADLDLRHAAGELRQAFLELLLVVVGGGLSISFLIMPMRPWISLVSPAPSMIVVFSFSTTIFLARPR